MAKPKLISASMAARILGFSHDYVRRLCLDGKIKGEKLGGNWVFPESAIANIKRQRSVKKEK